MPIYEYQCEKCGGAFEVMQSISAKPIKKCEDPKCGGKVERLVSATGFILKGSGWYATDYPSENRKKGWDNESNGGATETAPAPAATSGDTNGGKTESAPAPAATKPKPAPKKPAAKNPYSGGKTKKAKASK
ncbi:MAG: zinc ribbon domain-containing protein [Candidatus Nitrohelix vancouverensis]|uniref:Zinc ribbon domain-containing protein n=1 Tax=Candidatus Nitrohelix vancouverensis TaxID=2705534 RepID=A0A7T0G3E5_9BACT|nr:MAG: zinc ribbon domain-containing protein [Candidatus Nitrohelix vancouverensis]